MKLSFSMLLRFFLSIFIGLSFACSFAIPYFRDETYTLLDKFSLVAVPAFALTFVTYYIFSREKWTQISFSSRLILFGLAFAAATIWSFSTYADSVLQSMTDIVSLTVLLLILLFPSAPFLEKPMKTKDLFRLMLGWLSAAAVSFFITGFLSNFYTALYQVALLAVLSQLILGVLFFYMIGRIQSFMQKSAADFWIAFSLCALLLVFQGMIFWMGLRFPKMFTANIFLLEGRQIILFALTSIISLPWLAWILYRMQDSVFHHFLFQNKFDVFVRENLSGLTLASLFFGLYFLIGSVLNSPGFDVDDVFFDSDGFIWRYRLTTEHWQDFYWRSVHPLALLILKPGVALLSIFLHGNMHFAAIALTALAGAACVFLAWMFMKEILQDNVSALMMAFLLGISTSHLIFGSLIETYIFLAAATLFFFVLLQKENRSLPLLVSVGVMTMGMTLTNFAQTVIALFGAKPNFKFIFKFVFTVVVSVISLTLVSNLFYPNANPYFFVPSSFLAEEQNVRAVSVNRAQALVRAFLFNNIVAPSPLLSYKDIPFTQFRFYRAEDYKISEYSTPLQTVTGWTWASLLALAAIFFVKDFKSQNIKLTLSLLGCIAFNLLLHLRYGKELFLYSPNWTYAVVLLMGLAWKNLLPRTWFQVLLIAFFALLILNNAALIYTIMDVSSPYMY